MKIPEFFPPGCEFFASFSGDEYVVFPDGKVFGLEDSGEALYEARSLPRTGAAPISEAAFLSCAASCRKFAASKAAS